MSVNPVKEDHPLNALRRMGTVTSVANMPATITVAIGGDATNPDELPYLESYSPAVDDVVVLLTVQGDSIVVGAIAPTLTAGHGAPVGIFFPAPLTITGGIGTLTLTHGLPFTPAVVIATIGYAGSTPLHPQIFSISSTQVVFRVYRVADGSAQPDGALAVMSMHLACFQ